MSLQPLINYLGVLASKETYVNIATRTIRNQISNSFEHQGFFSGVSLSNPSIIGRQAGTSFNGFTPWQERVPWIEFGRVAADSIDQPNYKPLRKTGALFKSIQVNNRSIGESVFTQTLQTGSLFSPVTANAGATGAIGNVRITVPEFRPAGYRPPRSNIGTEAGGSIDRKSLMGDIHLYGGVNEKGRRVPQRQFLPISNKDFIGIEVPYVNLWEDLSTF